MHGAAEVSRPVTYQIGQVVEFVDLIERQEDRDRFPMSDSAEWYVAVTNRNCQARAALGLHDLGYRSFYPKVRRWVSHARVKTAKEKPLLGRYIFVEVDRKMQSFGAARNVNGIEGFVSNPDPVRVPTDYVRRLRERYMDGEWDFVRQEPCPFRNAKDEEEIRVNPPIPIGARIRLMEGEFADMLATVTGREGRKGKVVLFKLHDQNRYGKLHANDVRAA